MAPVLPFAAAEWSGDQPVSVRASLFAPLSSRIFTFSGVPYAAA